MQSLYSGIVGYWNLQDASGSRLDLTGNGSTLTNTNTVTSVDGVVGAASNFVRASLQRLNAASAAILQGGPKDYTLACWVNFTSVGAVDFGMMSKSSAVAGQKEYILYYSGTTNTFRMNVYRATDSAQIVASSFGAASLSTWYFVCGWFDNTNLTVNIEVNCGVTDTTSLAGAVQAASAAAFVIGDTDNAASAGLNGKTCEAAKWDRLLTTQERLWLYNKGLGRTYPFDGRFAIGMSRHGRSRRSASMLL